MVMPWGLNGSIGRHLFWESTELNNAKYQKDRQADGANRIKSGIAPLFEMAWDEPTDADAGAKQYNAWKQAHQQYWQRDKDGNLSTDAYYKDAISPGMPYDQADLPAGLTSGTRNDFDLDRLVSYAKATGAVGYFAADKYDSGMAWYQTAADWDFNTRQIDGFSAKSGISIPGTTISQKSTYIRNNCFSKWVDYLCENLAIRHTQLQPKLKALGVAHPIVVFQIDFEVADYRLKTMDLRMVAKRAAYGEVLKRIELQGDGLRIPKEKSATPVIVGTFAARAPGVMYGAQMSSNHDAFTDSMTLAGITKDIQSEWGPKYLKQHWLSVGWTHVANANGTLLRPICEFMRTYWDQGTIPDEVVSAVRTHKPVKPFGVAFYYSVAVERTYEDSFPRTNRLYPLVEKGGYGSGFGYAQQAVHAGLGGGYYVSDAALDSLQPANYPTAWLTSNTDRMPAAELAKLKAIAPVYDLATVSDWTTIPSPIKFTSGACGFAFQDQHNESIVLVWRQGRGLNGAETTSGATAMNCTVSFSDVTDGTYSVEDLFDASNTYPLTISGGKGSFAFPLDKWDCRAFKTTLLSPNGP